MVLESAVMRRLLNGVFVFSMTEIFVERVCMKVMQEYLNGHAGLRQEVSHEVMREYVNGHAGVRERSGRRRLGEVRLWLRYRLCPLQAGWPLPILRDCAY